MRQIRLTAVLLLLATAAFAQSPKLMLFGGSDHDVYLGCLNCNSFASDSVCNEFGQHGSEFASDSIWNEFGRFGSEFSSDSPWNAFGTNAPIIVDADGNFYGYFSRNEFHLKRTRIKALVAPLNLAGQLKLAGLQKAFCK